jgi:antitoxin VapB
MESVLVGDAGFAGEFVLYECNSQISGRPMAVIIEDEETDRLVRQLAERTGEPIDVAVRRAVFDRLQRVPLNEDEIARRKRKLAEVFAYFDSLPRINEHLTDDELIGYDENGLPV